MLFLINVPLYKRPTMQNLDITSREREVLNLVAFEYSSKEIADKLYISNHTVISHRQKLMHKLDVKNTAGLVRKGFEYGLISI